LIKVWNKIIIDKGNICPFIAIKTNISRFKTKTDINIINSYHPPDLTMHGQTAHLLLIFCYYHFNAKIPLQVIHQWPCLKYPEMAILKLVGVTAVLFLAGLLPWIDNYAHLFGFIYGFLLAYAMLPFVTFGVYARRRKLVLVWVCALLALLIFTGLILLFYVSPVIQDCEICKYFNCIPITKDFCSEQNIDLGTEV
jgi:hypothetical protein